jgi:hypothetical protein
MGPFRTAAKAVEIKPSLADDLRRVSRAQDPGNSFVQMVVRGIHEECKRAANRGARSIDTVLYLQKVGDTWVPIVDAVAERLRTDGLTVTIRPQCRVCDGTSTKIEVSW